MMQFILVVAVLVSVVTAFKVTNYNGKLIRPKSDHVDILKSQSPALHNPWISRFARPASVMDEVAASVGLNDKKREQVAEFVAKMDGKRSIQRILIANNGMAATKSILSMRQWAYMTFGDERTLEFVAMATRDDLNANAEFIRLADTYIEVPSGSNKNNYANVDLIISIAVAQKVDAVWPGWGHASENPKLPEGLKANGIQFIGPTAPVMAALGDKVSANILAQTAKVPSIPWSGDGIVSGLNKEGVIPPEVFKSACVFSAEEAAVKAVQIGYPVMIKASEGGGGKGIRMVQNPKDIKTSFTQVQNEVPGSPIFMMQLCTNARHLEVQIVGDEYGNAVALNGRDCSTQRRFQKIFEEGPPIVANREIFKEMELSAQRLTQTIGYIGAGTVEYLYNAAENKYYFLELNPRLQVEHPVTEGITGVNLPSVQLQVAMGIALDRIPQIRQFYGREPNGKDKIDFIEDDYTYPEMHVIAARITAENPDEGFKPTSGKIERVKFQSSNKVWGYFSVGANGGIHEYADSQFGHLFASGPTREDARKSLVLALKEVDVRGDIRTTVEYLIKLLETKEFKDNTIDTSWLDGIIREKSVTVLVPDQTVALTAAVFQAHSMVGKYMKDFVETLNKGQTSLQSLAGVMSFPIEITYDNVKYTFTAKTLGPNFYSLEINGQIINVRIREQPDMSLLCTINGENFQLFGQNEALGLRMKINGETVMIPTVYNPSELRSDVTGKIVRFLQQDREFVEKDEPYVEIEAMKMIMAVKATESGIIRHNLSPGSILSAGDLIADLQLKDPSKVKKISTFMNRLESVPSLAPPTVTEAAEAISLAMDGYNTDVQAAIATFFKGATAEEAEALIVSQCTKFTTNEVPFEGKEESDAVSTLAKANKDNLMSIVPNLMAQKQVKARVSLVSNLLRELEIMPLKFPGYSLNSEKMNDALKDTLSGLAALEGSVVYGSVSLKAKQIVDSSNIPAFALRLESLKSELMAGADLYTLAKQPDISVSVDILVVLMSDASASVRKAAMEVYLRRIYRAHCVKTLSIEETGEGMSAHWTFTLRETVDGAGQLRYGYMYLLPDFNEASSKLPKVINKASEYLSKTSSYQDPINVLHIGFSKGPIMDQDKTAKLVEATLAPFKPAFKEMDVRMANVLIVDTAEDADRRVQYFNHYSDTSFQEDPISRNMRPTMPVHFELNRLVENHELVKLATVGKNAQLYLGKERGLATTRNQQQVLFLRSISLSADTVSPGGSERVMIQAMEELTRARLDPKISSTASSRLFVNILADVHMPLDTVVSQFKKTMDKLVSKYATKLLKLRVDEIEVKVRVKESDAADSGFIPMRLIASSSTGGWLTREAYREYLDPVTGQTQNYCSVGDDSLCVLDPYPSSSVLQKKRSSARAVGSTYAADFLGLVEIALINSWQTYLEDSKQPLESPPSNLFSFEELVLDKDGEITKTKRFPGDNKIGMLAWLTTLKTPQYPEGREVVFIANDVTVQSGSFGVKEDDFFYKASEYARVKQIPRIFISCNSGARIGLVDELKPKYKVQWKNVDNPGLGFEYLYLSETDYNSLPAGTVDATAVVAPNGKTHYVLDAIIGQIHGIGVENLRGSGLIAGETSRAYDETFTLSYVTGRSVGIGAYLNRLGQRVIQMQQGPMILTGFSALNKLLGKEVYTSQDQLGGPQIMYPNGVTHEVVANDREGMQSVVEWLSYTPKDFVSITPAPKGPFIDPPERPVEFMPTKTPYDPRHMLGGQTLPDGAFVSGFFDKGSFKEYLGGWGKSVVVGRARLGGLNVGVIAVETRLVEQKIPADPGNPESREAIQPQAGQVWYPDSAHKTAQAIRDFDRGENLPLIVFANWRGFSGGTRDMYGEVLKYGAMIVDSLRVYKHPVFVYIPPNGELRGGAWVVIDPTINPAKMEMFADKQARGGILEPPGICEVKYRSKEQVDAMHRLDPSLIELDESIATAIDENERVKIVEDVKLREKNLAPIYTQIAHEFADLHDRAGRMKAKGVISEILDWKSAREYFYWRIQYRQKMDALKDEIMAASHNEIDLQGAEAMVKELIPADSVDTDKGVTQWLDANTSLTAQLVKTTKLQYSSKAIMNILEGLTPEEKKIMLGKIQ